MFIALAQSLFACCLQRRMRKAMSKLRRKMAAAFQSKPCHLTSLLTAWPRKRNESSRRPFYAGFFVSKLLAYQFEALSSANPNALFLCRFRIFVLQLLLAVFAHFRFRSCPCLQAAHFGGFASESRHRVCERADCLPRALPHEPRRLLAAGARARAEN